MNILAFIPLLSVMMLVHELGHFITARIFGITVQEFGFGLPPRLFGFKRGGVIYSINLIPFGAFVKMLGEEDPSAPGSFASKSRKVRAIVLAAGSAMNFFLAILAFTLAALFGTPNLDPTHPIKVNAVMPGTPAEQAGLRDGDIVVSFNAQPVTSGQQVRDLIQQSLDHAAQIALLREGKVVVAQVTPRSQPPEGQGPVGVVLGPNMTIVKHPLPTAIVMGVEQTVQVIGVTLMVPKLLIEGAITPSDARPIGLPGMAQLTEQAVDYALDTGFWYPIFVLTGMFSAGLSIANMLPIPALDGGRLLFVAIEWIRGRRVPPEREAAFHFVGIVVLLALMLLVSFNDITSPLPRVNWDFR